MTSDQQMRPTGQRGAEPLSQAEFVPLMALLMAVVALSIDIMLPTLPGIGRSFSLSNPNAPQLIVTSYLGGFAVGQLMWGPASDRFGRRPILLLGLLIFLVGVLGALLAGSFTALLAARVLQGLGASAPRVVSFAIIRDCFQGRPMARIMSLVMMIFMIVPVFAPMLGQILAHQGGWQVTFYALFAFGVVGLVWAGLRLPETRLDAARRQARGESLLASVHNVLSSRPTVGYTVAAAFMFGCLMAYINSAQQIFVDVFGLGDAFPIAFGAIASVMIPATFANARLVMRYGMRRVSHWALLGFIAASAGLLLFVFVSTPLLVPFGLLLAAAFFCFGLIVPNFNALAMEPLYADSGTGSSLMGFTTTSAAALIGGMAGQLFDGTLMPVALGFLLSSLAALAAVLVTDGAANFLDLRQIDG